LNFTFNLESILGGCVTHDVRILKSVAERATNIPKPRRKPVQSRSWQTSLAIQEAFVQLLGERHYDKVTIRDIVLVAGVALGSFYEYFTSKEELARTCVHFRSKRILKTLELCKAEVAGRPLAQGIDMALLALSSMIMREPAQWGQHFLLERRHSELLQYRADYEKFTIQWRALLEAAEDWPAGRDASLPALTLSTLVYGVLAHTAMTADSRTDFFKMREELRLATMSYLIAWLDSPLATD
jgi:AcrR family transcriptional regulator